MNTATETTFTSLFATDDDAKQFEDSSLSVGREYLPACALAVLDGCEATPEYWAWLAGQVEEAKAV